MVAAAGNLPIELERYAAGPAPYGSGNPVGVKRPTYPTAEQELAAAFEGQAPMLARDLAERLGPHRTVMLARAVGRAVAVGIKRRVDVQTTERLVGLYDVLAAGLDQVTDGCTTPEDDRG